MLHAPVKGREPQSYSRRSGSQLGLTSDRRSYCRKNPLVGTFDLTLLIGSNRDIQVPLL